MPMVRDELIEMRGLRFFYRDWAGPTTAAPTLVLLHGFTGHARSWDHFAEAMSASYRVLALDQRGHGQTQWAPPDGYDTTEMVEDLDAFVRAMDLNDFALLGLSMGGIVAFAWAGRRPVSLTKLVIVDIAPEIDPAGLARIRQSVAGSDVFATREEAFEQARVDNPIPPEDHHRYRVENNLMRLEDGRYTYRYDRALRDPGNLRQGIPPEEGWKLVADIEVPALLVRGETSDILSAGIADKMTSTMPDCRLVEVAGSGHPVPLDRPREFLSVVSTFL